MKKAFTMIELIFVIVILGILAAIAVPKLNATRDDAKEAVLKANIIRVFKDLQTHYVANGELKNEDIPKITNISLKGSGKAWALYDDEKRCISWTTDKMIDRYCIFSYKKTSSKICKKVLNSPELKPLLTDDNGLFLLDAPTTDYWQRICKQFLSDGLYD